MTTITTRAGKGSPLTNTEVDSNFTNLNSEKSFFVASSTAPTSPTPQGGDLWFDTGDGILFLYYDDGTSSDVPVWIDITGQGTEGSGETLSFPDSPSNGDTQTFFDITFTYNSTKTAWVRTSGGGSGGATSLLDLTDVSGDGTSGQVLTTNGSGSFSFTTVSGGSGGSVTVSATAPSSPSAGDLWWSTTNSKLYIYYTDVDTSQWVSVSGAATGDPGSTSYWVSKSSAYTASSWDRVFVDCSSAAVTITLPLSPLFGDEIRIIDATGNASTNNITIARNGNNIQGSASDLTVSTDRAAFGLVYYNSTEGWVLMEK